MGKIVTFSLHETLLKKLEDYCKKTQLSKSDVVREALIGYLKKRGIEVKVNESSESKKVVGCKLSDELFGVLDGFTKKVSKSKADILKEAVEEFLKRK
jgi:metal-responsive CopG/Arc/MetJ family transcriptional regulator